MSIFQPRTKYRQSSSKTTLTRPIILTAAFTIVGLSGGLVYALDSSKNLTTDQTQQTESTTTAVLAAASASASSDPVKRSSEGQKQTVSSTPSSRETSSTTIKSSNKGALVSPLPMTRNTSSFFVKPYSPAAVQAATWATSRPSDAEIMSRLGETPSAAWFGDWTTDVQQESNDLVTKANALQKTAVLVAYNIPQRDCGLYSAGGATSHDEYKNWIQSLANGIGQRPAIVILEPDAIAAIDCLSAADQSARYSLLSDAVHRLRVSTMATIYIDAGNAGWQQSGVTAERLRKANIAEADGFALNISNFYRTAESDQYGITVSQQVGNKHFVVDTSRNGNGSNGEWCNPAGRALGQTPTRKTGTPLADAYLWIKAPGESDGTCNGGPSAGSWWPEYALDLAKNAGW